MKNLRFASFTIVLVLIAAQALQARIRNPALDEPAPEAKQIIKIRAAGDADQPASEKVMHAFVVRGENNEPAIADVLTEIKVEGASNIEAGGPWLGIQFGPVSRPLATQLQLEKDRGQMVLNVLKDSPADMAAFNQYDVITQIDGQPVNSDLGAFLDIVRTFQPGETHTFTLLRGAKLIDVNLVVGTRPEDAAQREYVFEDDLGHVARGNVFKRGGIAMKDDSGNWTFNKLGDGEFQWNGLPGLEDGNFEALLERIPFEGHADTIFESSKGQSMRIEVGDGGKVTVTKTTTDANGNENTTTDTYDSMEDYKAQNPDSNVFMMHLDTEHKLPGGEFLIKPDNIGTFMLRNGDGNVDVKVQLQEMDERLKGLLERSENMMKQIEIDVDAGDVDPNTGVRKLHILRRIGEGDGAAGNVQIFNGKVATRFNVAPDGSITLTTRDGDAELVQEFDNADQLKAAMPDYYDRYAKLLDQAASAE